MGQDSSHCRMKMGKDENGKEILLKEDKFQVMMEWEKPYMQACIDALKPFGDVLEVGFGLGYSATHIQSFHPKSHTIIEYHPDIAKYAREWAKSYPNVTIVEDTWQNALSNLGVFDAIFFDDYPLYDAAQMMQMEEQTGHSQLALSKGKQLLQEVESTLPFLKEIKYTNEHLQELFNSTSPKTKREWIQLMQFLYELKKNGQILEKQFSEWVKMCCERGKVSPEEIKTEEKVCTVPNDRFFTFLQQCLLSHMRDGSRFSCFLSSPISKFEDPKFFQEIITNPYLEYHEEVMDIEVPSNCDYYHGTKALVITITKKV